MKIKLIHYETMDKMIWDYLYNLIDNDQRFDTMQDIIDFYENGQFYNADKTKDLQKRFCFDVWKASGGTKFACDTLYEYLNDDHIFTALKKILPPIQCKF